MTEGLEKGISTCFHGVPDRCYEIERANDQGRMIFALKNLGDRGLDILRSLEY